MENDYLGERLKEIIKNRINEELEEEIEKEAERFKRKLIDRKDNYVAEIMKGIRIYHEEDPISFGMNYKILFENITRLEK